MISYIVWRLVTMERRESGRYSTTPWADGELVDPKMQLEEACIPKCVKPLREYQACVKRIQGDQTGHKHCTGQYFDYWSCIDKCNSTRAGRLFSDGCYLRYDDHDFTNKTLSIEDVTRCGPDEFKGNQSEFRATAVELLGNLSVEAPRSGGFHMGFRSRENLSLYGLAQCWEYENASECGRCLKSGVSNMETCLAKDEGRFLSVGCYLRRWPLSHSSKLVVLDVVLNLAQEKNIRVEVTSLEFYDVKVPLYYSSQLLELSSETKVLDSDPASEHSVFLGENGVCQCSKNFNG
ncbi:hypothetical protein L1049_026398 [Liquidambar formosana]|uniref:Complex III subunit VI n=1 Tax=Liquidambar formosana TaxID=63359 RepID=A0AAP0NCN8_LIQFO